MGVTVMVLASALPRGNLGLFPIRVVGFVCSSGEAVTRSGSARATLTGTTG